MTYNEQEDNEEKRISEVIFSLLPENNISTNRAFLYAFNGNFLKASMLSRYTYCFIQNNNQEITYKDSIFEKQYYCNERSVQRAKRELKDEGFISVVQKGIPAIGYISVNIEKVSEILVQFKKRQFVVSRDNNLSFLSNIDNKINNIYNKERKKKESIRHNIHCAIPPLPPKGERSSDDELSQGGNDLIKLFEEDLWNNDITPKAGKAGSKKTAFERWKKITKNGQKNRAEVIEGWKRYLAFQKYYGYPVKRLQFFLNPKEELWNSPWEIDPDGAKSKIEKSTFEHSTHPKYWAECFFRNGEITRNEYARLKEISGWKYAGNEFKLLCEKKHKEGYYPKQNIEGSFYFTSEAKEASLKKRRQEQFLALKAQEIEKQNPDWKEASSEALPYDSLIDLAFKDKELFEKIENWCAFRKFEEAQKEKKAQEANRLKKELAINKIERERDEATNNLLAEFYQWGEENLNLDTFFEEHQETIKKLEKFLGKDFSLTDALCDIELNKNFEYQKIAIPFKMKLDDFLKKDATCAEKFKNLKKGVQEIYKTFNQKKGEIEK